MKTIAKSIAVLFLLAVQGCTGNTPPTDTALAASFEERKPLYELLVKMIAVDTNLDAVAMSYIRGNTNTFDLTRLGEYRSLLSDLGVISVRRYYNKRWLQPVTIFMLHTSGAFPDDSIYREIVFFPNGFPPQIKSQLVANLDDHNIPKQSGTRIYRRINDNWFISVTY